MKAEDSLKVLSQLSDVVGMLERKWPRPQSAAESAVIQTLLQVRETVRTAHEAKEGEVSHFDE